MTPGFIDLLAAIGGRSDAEMGAAWNWPDHDGQVLEVRAAYHRLLESELAAAASAPPPGSEAAAANDFGQAAFGDLVGLLAGQPDAALDAEPGGGEWPLRQVLHHILHNERRYQHQTRYGAIRGDEDPITNVPPDLERPDPADSTGGIRDWLARLTETRAGMAAVVAAAAGRLDRPTRWVGHDLDVRFRLHRFTGHLTEHTIHCEKVLLATGRPPAEARQLTRRIAAARGFHEFRTSVDALADLDDRQSGLVRSLG